VQSPAGVRSDEGWVLCNEDLANPARSGRKQRYVSVLVCRGDTWSEPAAPVGLGEG